MNAKAISEFWLFFSLGAALYQREFNTGEIRRIKSEINTAKTAKERDAELLHTLHQALTKFEDAHREAALLYEELHGKLFVAKFAGASTRDTAQVVIKTNGRSYTRHLRRVNGEWTGYGITSKDLVAYAVRS